MTDQRAAVAGVFDRAAETYDQVGVVFFADVGARLVREAGLSPGQRVVDVGCGRGAVLFPAAAAVGASGSVLGVDLAPAMVALTTNDAAQRGFDNVTLATMDAQEPMFESGTYDVVLASLVLFFLPDPLTGLRAWRQALRPSGRLAITTFADRDDERWSWLEDVFPMRDPRATSTNGDASSPFESDESLHELLAGAGFLDARSRTEEHVVPFADPDQWVAWSWSHGMRMFWERLPEDRRPDAQDRAVQELVRMQGEPEGITLRMVIRYTTAHAPH